MTTKIKWRLANRPTPNEITDLLKAGILNKDEAREILFSLETDEDRDKDSLKEEIKFLRALVEKLGTASQIITYIPQLLTPYQKYPFYQPYYMYSSGGGGGGSSLLQGSLSTTAGSSTAYAIGSASGGGAVYSALSQTQSNQPDFSDIKTF